MELDPRPYTQPTMWRVWGSERRNRVSTLGATERRTASKAQLEPEPHIKEATEVQGQCVIDTLKMGQKRVIYLTEGAEIPGIPTYD